MSKLRAKKHGQSEAWYRVGHVSDATQTLQSMLEQCENQLLVHVAMSVLHHVGHVSDVTQILQSILEQCPNQCHVRIV